jgi:polyhydroxybutyrate depolymerase
MLAIDARRFPGTRLAHLVNAFLGPQNHDIDGAETIWAFFRRFR